mgnify:CR=1 FL=1
MGNDLRKVTVSKFIAHSVEGSTYKKTYVLEPQGEALFHQFGVGYEELDGGPGNYTTAIVEWPDGHVESVPADQVQFVIPTLAGEKP